MDNKVHIGNDQLMFMVCCMFSVSGMLSLPMELTRNAFQDAWLAFYLSLPFGFLVAWLLCLLMKRVPGQNLFEISKAVCGKWVGGVLNIGLILFLLLQLVMHLRMYGDFIHSSILNNTPVEFILLLTVLVLIYYGNGTLLELARSVALYFPVWVILNITLPLILMNEIDWHKLQPSLVEGPVSLWKSEWLGIGAFGDIIALGAFLNQVKNPRGFYISVKTGIAVSVLILTIWVILVITTLGASVASKFLYVGWILTQLIHITDYLDRIDLFEITVWLPNLIVKYSVLYLAILTGIASFTKSKNYKPYNLLMGGIVTLLSVWMFADVRQVIFSVVYGTVPLALVVYAVFLGAVFLGTAVRKKSSLLSEERKKPNLALWIALLAAGLILAIGSAQRSAIGKYGIYYTGSYLLLLLVAVYLSIREFRKLSGPS